MIYWLQINSLKLCHKFQIFGNNNKSNLPSQMVKNKSVSEKICYHFDQNLFSSHLLSKILNIKMYKTIILGVVLYCCETWSLSH
jgi:hypothetical protein